MTKGPAKSRNPGKGPPDGARGGRNKLVAQNKKARHDYSIEDVLEAVGLYGVLAYSVSQRTREIGVRMALGADSGRVQRMVLRQVGLMVAAGATIGAFGAFAVGRAAQSLLFGLAGHDPVVFVSAVSLLAAVAFGAGWLPARRASRTPPMMALRYD